VTPQQPTQITIDVENLRTLLAHATFAARSIGQTGPIAEHINAIANGLGEVLAEHLRGARVPSASATFEVDVATHDAALETAHRVAHALDDLRELIGRAEALVQVADDLFREVQPSEADAANRRRRRIRHLLGAVSDSAGAALGTLAEIDKVFRRAGAGA
jgi:hypothetical protein